MVDGTDILRHAVLCANCDARYDIIWGVPFFGRYEPDDILGLIEIAANIINRGRFGVTPEVVEQWEQTLADYHVASDKEEFLATNPHANSPYLLNRYGEWQELHRLTDDMDLRGQAVLDVGAGLGFDSHRLSLRGADVTALEFSPILSEAGAQNFPKIRWIGGFAHALPFQTACFDAVFCNAALHHMRNIPAAITECLRVLKPGGYLITTCDSFHATNSPENLELRVFDRDPTVLMGVNERIPQFVEFVSPFLDNRERLDIQVFTHTLYGAPSSNGSTCTLTALTEWNLDRDVEMLQERSGSLALKVKLNEPWDGPPAVLTAGVLDAGALAPSLTDESTALARLAPLIPSCYVNAVFPGTDGTKFELLNGWRLPCPTSSARTAYRQGRWFLRRKADEDRLRFQLMTPAATADRDREVAVFINGSISSKFRPTPGRYQPIELDLTGVRPDVPFAVEIRRLTDLVELEAASFEVRNRRFCGSTAGLAEKLRDLERAFAGLWSR